MLLTALLVATAFAQTPYVEPSTLPCKPGITQFVITAAKPFPKDTTFSWKGKITTLDRPSKTFEVLGAVESRDCGQQVPILITPPGGAALSVMVSVKQSEHRANTSADAAQSSRPTVLPTSIPCGIRSTLLVLATQRLDFHGKQVDLSPVAPNISTAEIELPCAFRPVIHQFTTDAGSVEIVAQASSPLPVIGAVAAFYLVIIVWLAMRGGRSLKTNAGSGQTAALPPIVQTQPKPQMSEDLQALRKEFDAFQQVTLRNFDAIDSSLWTRTEGGRQPSISAALTPSQREPNVERSAPAHQGQRVSASVPEPTSPLTSTLEGSKRLIEVYKAAKRAQPYEAMGVLEREYAGRLLRIATINAVEMEREGATAELAQREDGDLLALDRPPRQGDLEQQELYYLFPSPENKWSDDRIRTGGWGHFFSIIEADEDELIQPAVIVRSGSSWRPHQLSKGLLSIRST